MTKLLLLLSCAAVLLLVAQAEAVPIHRHLEILRPSNVEPARTVQHVVRVEHVAPPYVPPPTPAPSYTAPTTSTSGCTGMEAESGTAGYGAYNSSSGATGCYQIIPSTAANYGCDLSTPAGQDACAAEICADVGNSAWSSSGATPCG